MNIEQKLDQLAEFYSQKDALELQKRELLDEIKVPAKIEQIVKKGMEHISVLEDEARIHVKAFDVQIEKRLAEIIIPQEYKDALAELDRQREEITAKMGEVEAQKQIIRNEQNEYRASQNSATVKAKQELQASIEKQTHDVYAAINQRKQEIEAEFSGKADDAQANIEKLEAEIRDDVKKQAAEKLAKNPKTKELSVKGSFFHAVYGKARKTWITAKLDDYVETHPDIKNCYTEGEPSVTIRRI